MGDGGKLPTAADTVILGGGTAGAVVAAMLAAGSDESILVLEAGPDYGPAASGAWPAIFLDARLGYDNAWAYSSGDQYPGRELEFERAKVIGGCSAHNGCAAIWGHRVDYDGWVARGNPGWSAGELRPLFEAADRHLRVRDWPANEVTPFQAACLAAAAAAGLAPAGNLNDLDEDEGIAPSPANIRAGVRWNTAFGFLDAVRDRPNLAICGDVLVDRLLIEGSRVTGVTIIGPEGPATIQTGRVVLTAGTYGSPAILLRSGVGEPAALQALGITPVLDLPGVGANLHDHSQVNLELAGTPALIAAMVEHEATHWTPTEQVIAKIRSAVYPEDEPGFDLHIWPMGGRDPRNRDHWTWLLPVSCMTPRSRGRLTLTSADPAAPPRLDHAYLSDPAGHDRQVLLAGLKLARTIARQAPLATLAGAELAPGAEIATDADLLAWIDANVVHYYHPVGTCAMGPASDPLAVADARGKVHGLANAFVADCSLMPVIPRANTNLPAVVVGMRIAEWLRAPAA